MAHRALKTIAPVPPAPPALRSTAHCPRSKLAEVPNLHACTQAGQAQTKRKAVKFVSNSKFHPANHTPHVRNSKTNGLVMQVPKGGGLAQHAANAMGSYFAVVKGQQKTVKTVANSKFKSHPTCRASTPQHWWLRYHRGVAMGHAQAHTKGNGGCDVQGMCT